jgi:hypothetical protein
MGWETRRSGTYYYKKTRRGNKVVSEYVGAGLVGVCSSVMDAEAREEQAEASAERHRAEAAMDARCRRVETACDLLASLATALMKSSGYHKHKGQWRRKRMALPETTSDKSRRIARESGLTKQMEKARDGDMPAFRAVRKALENDPERFVGITCTDLTATALDHEAYWQSTDRDGKTDYLQYDGTLTAAALLRAELSGPNPTAVERLLVERVVLSWVQTHWFDMTAAVLSKEGTYSATDKIDRRRTRAHNRYLGSLRTLAAVRRVAPSRVQNVQINAHMAAPPALESMTFPALESIQSPLPDRKPNAYTDAPADPRLSRPHVA